MGKELKFGRKYEVYTKLINLLKGVRCGPPSRMKNTSYDNFKKYYKNNSIICSENMKNQINQILGSMKTYPFKQFSNSVNQTNSIENIENIMKKELNIKD